MYEDRHHTLTRILFSFLVILFCAGVPVRFALGAPNAQGGTIRGKVVADIADQRRILPGVSPNFGTFYNSPERSVRLKFEFVKY